MEDPFTAEELSYTGPLNKLLKDKKVCLKDFAKIEEDLQSTKPFVKQTTRKQKKALTEAINSHVAHEKKHPTDKRFTYVDYLEYEEIRSRSTDSQEAFERYKKAREEVNENAE